MKFYSAVFNVSEWKILTPDYAERTLKGRPGNFRMKVALALLGNIELELVQPLEGESLNAQFLQSHGDGLHHVASFVSNIAESIARLNNLGFKVVQSGKRPGAEFAYLQNPEEPSIIIELLKRS
jgi:4-hydroxyphenylpyruvate dioxygenase-like putative hemolysin